MGAVPGKRYSPYSFRNKYTACNRNQPKGIDMNDKLTVTEVYASTAHGVEMLPKTKFWGLFALGAFSSVSMVYTTYRGCRGIAHVINTVK